MWPTFGGGYPRLATSQESYENTGGKAVDLIAYFLSSFILALGGMAEHSD